MAALADHKVIKDETLNILLAGRDTTSCTLTFAVYALAQHPRVLARLRAEVRATVGPARRPTYDDVREMKYMRAFINEVLRLYPPVCVSRLPSPVFRLPSFVFRLPSFVLGRRPRS